MIKEKIDEIQTNKEIILEAFSELVEFYDHYSVTAQSHISALEYRRKVELLRNSIVIDKGELERVLDAMKAAEYVFHPTPNYNIEVRSHNAAIEAVKTKLGVG